MENFTLQRPGEDLTGYSWDIKSPKAVMIIVHGLAEHAARYGRFAQALNGAGIAVYSMDLRGHGKSIGGAPRGWFAKSGGYQIVLEDIRALSDYAKARHAGIPCILFGHSMGSIFARAAIQDYGDAFAACILSGVTTGVPGTRKIAPVIASIVKLFGHDKPSKFMDNLSFGSYNKSFSNPRTKFDWLSRDEAEVDKYVADDFCGFVATPALFHDLSVMLISTIDKENLDKIPKNMHILIVSGAKDPCGSFGQDAGFLANAFQQQSLDVAVKVYEDARHELLNELNRQQVTGDIIDFMKRCI